MDFRRNLPHIHPKGAIFFITFMLDGALPKVLFNKFIAEKELRISKALQNGENTYNLEKFFFGKFDNLLNDESCEIKWLNNEKCSEIVSSKMLEFDKVKYDLLVYCIMPNHVHMLFDMQNYWPLNQFETLSGYSLFLHNGKTKNYPVSDIMRLLKGNTARECNGVLNRSGHFWKVESYDHFIRNRDELGRVIGYIMQNPVKANLVSDWKHWKHTYVAPYLFKEY